MSQLWFCDWQSFLTAKNINTTELSVKRTLGNIHDLLGNYVVIFVALFFSLSVLLASHLVLLISLTLFAWLAIVIPHAVYFTIDDRWNQSRPIRLVTLVSSNPLGMKSLPVKWNKRVYAVQEIRDSEIRYVESLEKITYKYRAPLEEFSTKYPKSLPRKDCDLIFEGLDVILELNKRLSVALTEKVSGFDPRKDQIGELFVRMAGFFKAYKVYIETYAEAIKTLDKLKQDKKFRAQIEQIEKQKLLKDSNLESLLIMPVQRVPRYVLLLKAVQKYTPPEHLDFPLLEEAIKILQDICSEMNETGKLAQDRMVLMNIQDKLKMRKNTVPIIAPHRVLVNRNNDFYIGEDQPVHVLLCSDILMVFKEMEDWRKCHYYDQIQVCYLENTTTVAEGNKLHFMEYVNVIGSREFQIFSKDKELVKKWSHDINELASKVKMTKAKKLVSNIKVTPALIKTNS